MTRASEDTTHTCPGCGQPGVPRHQLSCKRDWRRLPADIRNRINGTYYNRRGRGQHIAAAVSAHREALAEALAWYRENQVTP